MERSETSGEGAEQDAGRRRSDRRETLEAFGRRVKRRSSSKEVSQTTRRKKIQTLTGDDGVRKIGHHGCSTQVVRSLRACVSKRRQERNRARARCSFDAATLAGTWAAESSLPRALRPAALARLRARLRADVLGGQACSPCARGPPCRHSPTCGRTGAGSSRLALSNGSSRPDLRARCLLLTATRCSRHDARRHRDVARAVAPCEPPLWPANRAARASCQRLAAAPASAPRSLAESSPAAARARRGSELSPNSLQAPKPPSSRRPAGTARG